MDNLKTLVSPLRKSCQIKNGSFGDLSGVRSLVTGIFIFLLALQMPAQEEANTAEAPNLSSWAEQLGFPADKIILILHADDIGMCEEANLSAVSYLAMDQIQSAAAMPPCPNFNQFIAWAIAHPKEDVGLHLTLTSEWKTHRWGTVADPSEVPGLLDSTGMMWHSVRQVVQHASPVEVETEVRAQIEKFIALGHRPDHIDTHMGTLYGSPAFTAAYTKVAEEYQIPAMVIDVRNPLIVQTLRAQGYPVSPEMLEVINNYSLPKLDYFYSIGRGNTYEEKCENFKTLVKSWRPGLTEIIFHPSEDTERLKTITGSWQQRIWEARMFADPKIIAFLEEQGIIFTDWQEIMARYRERK